MSDTLTIRPLDREVVLKRVPSLLDHFASEDGSVHVRQFFGGGIYDPPSWEAIVIVGQRNPDAFNDHDYAQVRAWDDYNHTASIERLDTKLRQLREWLNG